jgi:WD40 repeat protein
MKTLSLTAIGLIVGLLYFSACNTPKQIETPELLIQIGHVRSVNSVAISSDGKTLASGSHDKTIKLWDVSSGNLIRTLQGHINPVLFVAFSPDGKTLASGSEDNNIKLWEVSSGNLIRTLQGHNTSVLAFSPDGKLLASGSSDMTKIWSTETDKGLSKNNLIISFRRSHAVQSYSSILATPDEASD